MYALNFSTVRIAGRLAMTALFLVVTCATALATDGTWTNTAGGSYSDTGNWQSSTVASGVDATANFNTLDISDYPIVTLDTNPTLGHLIFGDTNTGTPGVWIVASDGVGTNTTVTLDGTAPSITVNELGPVDIPDQRTFDEAFLRVDLAGTGGFTKDGPGVLTLAGDISSSTVSITGGINVDEGTLRFDSGAVFTTDSFNQLKTLADGTTLENNATTLNNVTVASGASATLTLNGTTTNYVSNVIGSDTGETLNVNLATGGTVYSFQDNHGGMANLNITGTDATASVIRARINGGSFFEDSFDGTHLNLDNASIYWRTWSHGAAIPIGALSGTSTATLEGAQDNGAVRFTIGSLNTSTTFAGNISCADTGTRGLSIDKVGTGTLTLSGQMIGDDTNNSWNNGETDIGRQGGVVRVSEGTLALTGAATSFPGGYGAFWTTIDVLPGATLDVSGTSTTFSTSVNQQVQGEGTIVGDYLHDEGAIRAADVSTPYVAAHGSNTLTNVPIATVGTITFDDNLTFSGGEIVYDMDATPAGSNDLIQVNGTTSVAGGGTVTPNFMAGTPAVGQTYTVLNSVGGFSDAVSGWTVAWPGRGTKPTVFINGSMLQFTTTATAGGASLIWTGSTSSAWDVEATQNWTNGGSPDVYFQGDDVTFDETATNKTVTLDVAANPASVTVDSTSDYTIGGSGYIGGTGTFTKRGSSTLTMQLPNGFSGDASIEAGTVDIGGANGALGTGNLTLAGGIILSTGGGLNNSGITVATGSSNTIQVDGGTGSSSTYYFPALSGDGDVTLTSTVDDKWFSLGDTTAFAGTLSVGPDGVTGTSMTVRILGFSASMPGAAVVLSNGAAMSNRNGGGSTTTIALGSLAGDSTTSLVAFVGGGSLPETAWEIGARNESTEFAGVIADQDGGALSSVTKVGTGTLVLSGANTYTADTRVEAGTLSITSAYLADAADVYLTTGATFDLNFSGTDTIDELIFDGIDQVIGTWGSLASSATNKSDFFTGLGILDVTTYTAPPLLIGDYNSDGIVDAADYTVWRDNLGGATLNNRDPANTGVISESDYASWKLHFGEMSSPGSGSLAAGAVPEPSTALLALVALLGSLFLAGRRER